MKPLRMASFVVLAVSIAATSTFPQAIPERLSDAEFWKLSSESSEADGTFRSDNLLSNEIYMQYVIPDLIRTAKADRIYMGVGPEQNFTYIAALRPKMALIIDIRRGNLDLHLMYKALFELSGDRAEFVSRLFSRKRPEGLTGESTASQIFNAFVAVETSETLYRKNLKALKDHLTTRHGFELNELDVKGIDAVYGAFYQFGPAITYNSNAGNFGRGGGGNRVTYAELMSATDQEGAFRSYLANEETFIFLKDFHSRNLLVPVIGDFAGPKAIRAVGKYLKGIGATVSAFYLSNVEDYLGGIWQRFCANTATLPLDETSTFIRSMRGGRYGGSSGGLSSDLGNILTEIKACPAGAR